MQNDSTPTAIGTTPDVYDKVTIRLHWATAALVSILWVMGRTIGFMPRGPLRLDMWSVHILLGTMLTGVLVARIVWRATSGRKLPSNHNRARIACASGSLAALSASRDRRCARCHQRVHPWLSPIQHVAVSENRRERFQDEDQQLARPCRKYHHGRSLGACSRSAAPSLCY